MVDGRPIPTFVVVNWVFCPLSPNLFFLVQFFIATTEYDVFFSGKSAYTSQIKISESARTWERQQNSNSLGKIFEGRKYGEWQNVERRMMCKKLGIRSKMSRKQAEKHEKSGYPSILTKAIFYWNYFNGINWQDLIKNNERASKIRHFSRERKEGSAVKRKTDGKRRCGGHLCRSSHHGLFSSIPILSLFFPFLAFPFSLNPSFESEYSREITWIIVKFLVLELAPAVNSFYFSLKFYHLNFRSIPQGFFFWRQKLSRKIL